MNNDKNMELIIKMASNQDVDTLKLKEQKNSLIADYAVRKNSKALLQTLTTIIPYFILFYTAIAALSISYWLSAAITAVLVLFILRVFVIMHDCGHNCLYEKPRGNAITGFILGVMCGVPQFVWSKHHDYHHATNGNWEKYRGPLAVLSASEYEKLTSKQRKSYARARKLFMGPIAGFLYFIFNPRFNWLKGNVQLIRFIIKEKIANKNQSLKDISAKFETRSWGDWQEYRHMTANNLTLFCAWAFAISYFGAIPFFTIYTIALSLAGALGIILFTVQHNFENSYAVNTQHWDYFAAAIHGTSFLQLPRWLNWFTADIAYHHIHHLSARIPNYNLVACHNRHKDLFNNVPRLSLFDIPGAFKYVIWDEKQQTLITAKQFSQSYSRQPTRSSAHLASAN